MFLVPTETATRINLTFHGVGRSAPGPGDDQECLWLTTESFRAMLDAVRVRPNVSLTFDDSNRSDLEIALPELLARGLRATFFVLVGRLGDPAHLSADDIRTLARAGMGIGTHGMDHLDWRDASEDALERELGEARRRLETVCGRSIKSVAIPFGHYDRRVLSALRRHGYARVYTSDGGAARPGSWLQPRTSLRSTDGVSELAMILDVARPLRVRAAREAKLAVKRWR